MPPHPTITLPDDPLATLRPAPPCVLAPAERFEQVKRRMGEDADLARHVEGVRADAQKLLDEPVLTHDIPDGRRLLWVSRKAVDRITDLAFTWRLQPDEALRDRAWAELEAVCAFPDWNPAHFLDTAEMSHAVAIGYDWLHEAWSDGQRRHLREAVIRLGIEPALKVYRRDKDHLGHNWDTHDNNWNIVCNGGISTAALAIATDEPDLARDVLRFALPRMPICLRHFAPDGGWPEGPGYWGYTIRYLVATLATLRTARWARTLA